MKITNENIGKFDKDKGVYCGIFRDKEVWISLSDAPEEMEWQEAMDYAEKQGGELPDIDTLTWVYLNKGAINAALEANGGDKLNNGWYWSSSESGSHYSWGLGMSDGGRYDYGKYNYGYARAFQLLPLYPFFGGCCRISKFNNKQIKQAVSKRII
ncbi:MAG: hypothetical protein IJ184_07295 [Alphaproteobacteria bacterium]|nr:hypothetical protein [Alphaproteobacteria bacterium]